jgi:KipI family sensor histidine kinase inhibitor
MLMLYDQPTFRLMGDRALLVEMGDQISPSINEKVRELFLKLDRTPAEGVVELVPGYRSLMVVYDPLRIGPDRLREAILQLHQATDPSLVPEPRTLQVPVVYGGEYGPDLEWVADFHKISQEQVISLHVGTTYRVYMIGFTPGYPYLGELPEGLATPRRETPRTAVPQGSVAIAQRQTGIYPAQSPGGWHILGWTPMKLFDAGQWPPTPLEMGDRVRFIPIHKEEIDLWTPSKA